MYHSTQAVLRIDDWKLKLSTARRESEEFSGAFCTLMCVTQIGRNVKTFLEQRLLTASYERSIVSSDYSGSTRPIRTYCSVVRSKMLKRQRLKFRVILCWK